MKEYQNEKGIFRTGRFNNGTRWYGRMYGVEMKFITKEQFELGIKEVPRPELEAPPF